jgi:glycine oxidase
MTSPQGQRLDLIVVGGGVIGLACAWRAAKRGLAVRLLERDSVAAGATGVAAGMLAPVGEAYWGEDALLSLNLESLELWPEFARELEEDAGGADYRRLGALHVGLDRDEAEELRRRHALHQRLGLDSTWLLPADCRRLEPGLSSKVQGGVHAPGEAAVDPQGLARQLASTAASSGVAIQEHAEVISAERDGEGWRVKVAGEDDLLAESVLAAAGAWTADGWLPPEIRLPVRPVKGEVLTLRGSPERPACERIVVGERVYLVPRADGRLLIGATVEERGFDTTVTAGGVHELLREAYRLVPEIAELELLSARAGLRPGTPDNAPLIGRIGDEGLLVATGHYRNGVLLAPVTAEAVAALAAGEEPRVDLTAFDPSRFGDAPSPPSRREEAEAR